MGALTGYWHPGVRRHNGCMSSPTPADFAALARSSPWRFSTLTFTLRWHERVHPFDAVRAYLRRPDLLRVETLDGDLIQVIQKLSHAEVTGGVEFGHAELFGPAVDRSAAMSDSAGYAALSDSAGWAAARMPAPRPDLSPSAAARPGESGAFPGLAPTSEPRPSSRVGFDDEPAPEFRPDGLVDRRPESAVVDAPMFENYYFTALLDPVELADGRDPETGVRREGTVISDVAEVDHGGRPAWQATIQPGQAYEPRCPDCSLMRDRRVDLDEFGPDPDARYLLADYPTGYRVRLDVGTGVCVLIEALDGSNVGDGHEVVIEAVGADLPDAMFVG